MFFVSLAVVGVFNIIFNLGLAFIMKIFGQGAVAEQVILADTIASPFFIPMLVVLLFVSMVVFSYADISGGFIKNIAGQIPNKSSLIISKFIVIGVHNLMFFAVGSLTNMIGKLIVIGMGMAQLADPGNIAAALLTLLLKWLLSMAIAAILLFVTNGIRNKVLGSVIGVIIGTGSLSLAYMGLSTAVDNIFHTENFNLAMYMPDTLMNNVSVAANTAVINAVIVSVVCIAIFLTLTIKVFNSRDIK